LARLYSRLAATPIAAQFVVATRSHANIRALRRTAMQSGQGNVLIAMFSFLFLLLT
jgi:hypothetical protein